MSSGASPSHLQPSFGAGGHSEPNKQLPIHQCISLRLQQNSPSTVSAPADTDDFSCADPCRSTNMKQSKSQLKALIKKQEEGLVLLRDELAKLEAARAEKDKPKVKVDIFNRRTYLHKPPTPITDQEKGVLKKMGILEAENKQANEQLEAIRKEEAAQAKKYAAAIRKAKRRAKATSAGYYLVHVPSSSSSSSSSASSKKSTAPAKPAEPPKPAHPVGRRRLTGVIIGEDTNCGTIIDEAGERYKFEMFKDTDEAPVLARWENQAKATNNNPSEYWRLQKLFMKTYQAVVVSDNPVKYSLVRKPERDTCSTM